MYDIDRLGVNEYPNIEKIDLEKDEAAGILERLADEGNRLTVRNFRLGLANATPLTIILSEKATKDVEDLFGNVDSRIGKPIVVRTDQGKQLGDVWTAVEVISPKELED